MSPIVTSVYNAMSNIEPTADSPGVPSVSEVAQQPVRCILVPGSEMVVTGPARLGSDGHFENRGVIQIQVLCRCLHLRPVFDNGIRDIKVSGQSWRVFPPGAVPANRPAGTPLRLGL